MKCPECEGSKRGFAYNEPCPRCKGTGEVSLCSAPESFYDSQGCHATACDQCQYYYKKEVPDLEKQKDFLDFVTCDGERDGHLWVSGEKNGVRFRYCSICNIGVLPVSDPKEPHKLYHCSKCGETFDHENHKDWHEERCKIDPKSHQEVSESFKPREREVYPVPDQRVYEVGYVGTENSMFRTASNKTDPKGREDEVIYKALEDLHDRHQGKKCKCGREMERQWVCEHCGNREG